MNWIFQKCGNLLRENIIIQILIFSIYEKKGVHIGEYTTIYEPSSTWIDSTRPWLVEIGNNVNIMQGVIILTHGYDWLG